MRLLEVARQYYEHGMGQAEIAQATGMSRPTVGRMLKEAREVGIVRIQVAHPFERSVELERNIQSRYGVQHVRASTQAPQESGFDAVARECSALLDDLLASGMRIGLTNGRVHSRLPHALDGLRHRSVEVVQMSGRATQGTRILDGAELIQQVADRLGGTAVTMSAPLLAPSAEAARDLRATPQVRDALERAAQVDVALIGIGAGFRHPASVFSGALTADVVRRLHSHGAVGHVVGRFMDASGEEIRSLLEDRVIGTPLEELRRIPLVVALAAGPEKAPAIAAALRAGLVDVLVVDVIAAQELAHLPE
ncbi:DNA-binding transcriptional regulator LsrR, DeoR family [Agrococcus baldri]|uniref:DNA-binding transcriptional regulator LsrR, DeoR family n=2 Tax=Agrococcus baldri TaxID=153730 RepID=A0AA94KZN7_9MICO|nr:DNA-binding transcriptional regulator LsrR, DeoR family [Agrococcus baldri]